MEIIKNTFPNGVTYINAFKDNKKVAWTYVFPDGMRRVHILHEVRDCDGFPYKAVSIVDYDKNGHIIMEDYNE